VSDETWLEARSAREVSAILVTLARHGVSGACVAGGDRYYVRIPGGARSPELLRELAAVLERPRETGEPGVALSAELRGELGRLGAHPVREIRRLESEAAKGENPATPAILVAGLAVSLWTLVAVVATTAVLVAHLVV